LKQAEKLTLRECDIEHRRFVRGAARGKLVELLLMESKSQQKRKYQRHKAPKGLFVGWKSAGKRTVSRAETIGMGGLFLHTPDPPTEGSVIELLFDLKAGEVRARAIVRHRLPGEGMGVQFVQMQSADRARLNQFLLQCAAASPFAESGARRSVGATPQSGRKMPPKNDASIEFERELNKLLELARRGTHYQLFGVAPDASGKDIRTNFYRLARQFHPDYHMGKPEWMPALKELIGLATSAYKTLVDEEKRSQYDAHLSTSGAFQLHRTKTAAQETVEQCFSQANECLRAENFVGSIVWLRKCVEMSPDEARYHALLARSLSTVSQYRQEAIREFERAIELNPWDTLAYMQFGELYESMQLISRARSLYSKVLEINPVHLQARERLAGLGGERREKAATFSGAFRKQS
jgi:tetratricopeptide (TPR) repeat protein